MGLTANRELTEAKVVIFYPDHQISEPIDQPTSALRYINEIKSKKFFRFESQNEPIKEHGFNVKPRAD